MAEKKNSSRTGISCRNYHITIDTYDINLKNSQTSLSYNGKDIESKFKGVGRESGFFVPSLFPEEVILV